MSDRSSSRWRFSKERILNTPSRSHGFDADKELSHRQQAANFIKDVAERGLKLSMLTTNTAIVYMHRFYMFHSLKIFQRYSIAAAAVFLAAKTEEQPRFLEHVVKTAHFFLNKENLEVDSAAFKQQAAELVLNEQLLLKTLGFDLTIEHPHTHILRLCTLVQGSKDLSHACWCMASYMWHLTTMCLEYSPTVIACVSVYLACKWLQYEIPPTRDGQLWFQVIDKQVNMEVMQRLSEEFLEIVKKFPKMFKNKSIFSQKFKVPTEIIDKLSMIDSPEVDLQQCLSRDVNPKKRRHSELSERPEDLKNDVTLPHHSTKLPRNVSKTDNEYYLNSSLLVTSTKPNASHTPVTLNSQSSLKPEMDSSFQERCVSLKNEAAEPNRLTTVAPIKITIPMSKLVGMSGLEGRHVTFKTEARDKSSVKLLLKKNINCSTMSSAVTYEKLMPS